MFVYFLSYHGFVHYVLDEYAFVLSEYVISEFSTRVNGHSVKFFKFPEQGI